MFRLNETWWRQPLTISLKELAGALDLSETAIKEARLELVKSGHLRHEAQGGNRAPKYFLLSNICYGDIVRRSDNDGRNDRTN